VIRIDVVDTGVQAALRALQQRVGNLQPAMKEIGLALTESTRLRFKESKDPQGNPWKPLSKITLQNRAMRLMQRLHDKGKLRTKKGKVRLPVMRQIYNIGKNGMPLLDTGRLRNSITYNADKNSVSVGTNVVYAAIHQFGGETYLNMRAMAKDGDQWHKGEAHTHRIPARPFLGLSASDRDEVIDILRRRIMDATA